MNTLPQDVYAVADNAERTDDVSELEVLGTKKESYQGDFVLEGQETSGDKGFSHVSRIWYNQCVGFDAGFEAVRLSQSNIADIKVPLNKWESVVENDQCVLRYKPTGRTYVPTENCLLNMSIIGRGRFGALKDLAEDKPHATKEDVILWSRDRRDADLMCSLVSHYLFLSDRVDQNKVRLFRTYDGDNTLRAILSKDYTVINNEWLLQTMSELIPGGMLSHFKGDPDAIIGNVLIPDTIRAEEDSDYGGMLCFGNSEIGTRRLTNVPSVFRAICMNGCIWDQEIGKGIDSVHRKKDGKIDLDALKNRIKVHLEKQIPLIDSGIRLVLDKKTYGFDGVPIRNVVAAVMQNQRIVKKAVPGILDAYRVESAIVGDNAFAIMNAMTRYGQTRGMAQWNNLDVTAGNLARMNRTRWDSIVAAGKALDDKQLEKLGVV